MKKNIKNRKKLSKAGIVLIAGLVTLAIPVIILVWILGSAFFNTGKPINGDRFNGDLDPAITNDDIKNTKEVLKSISNVENVEIVLKTSAFRVYVDTLDSIGGGDVQNVSKAVVAKIFEKLPLNTYFTSSDLKKMYDLEVHVYTKIPEQEGETFIYYIANKNSSMSEVKYQLVSEPLNKDLANELRNSGN